MADTCTTMEQQWPLGEGFEAFKANIRVLCEHNSAELAVMKVLINKLDGDLFGASGRTGRIDKLDKCVEVLDQKVDDKHEATSKRLNAIERYFYIAIGALGILQFLTGSGVLSLKAFMGK